VNLYLCVTTLIVVQSGYKDVYWFGHERPYVQWVSLRFVLPCTRVLAVGVTSFREREQVPSLLGGGGGCFDRFDFDCYSIALDVAPAFPFITSKRRAWVTFAVKW
jgi:hypothetical protein